VSSGEPIAPPHAPLSGHSVLVTGASSGIGQAIALAVARAGAEVTLTYRTNHDGAKATAQAIAGLGRRATVLQLDLADQRSRHALLKVVRSDVGRIDAWINNAGADILTGAGAQLTTEQKLDLLLAIDLRGTMLLSWAAVELMQAQPAGGVVINMSWDHVITGMAGTNPQLFAAVKGGVLAFSKALARTVAPQVRVNVIAPGWIETSFGSGANDRLRQEVTDETPLKRWGTPDDVAGAAVYLASPAAAFLTGQTIMVGGGLVM